MATQSIIYMNVPDLKETTTIVFEDLEGQGIQKTTLAAGEGSRRRLVLPSGYSSDSLRICMEHEGKMLYWQRTSELTDEKPELGKELKPLSGIPEELEKLIESGGK